MNLRAARRALKRLMKSRARRAWPDRPDAERYADHMASCSCAICGNPRHYAKGAEKLTIQERREDERREEAVR